MDDSPAVISPPGGPPGLNMRRSTMQGPPGGGEWHPEAEGWRRAAGPPQEWRGPPVPAAEEHVPPSPRRQANSWASQARPETFFIFLGRLCLPGCCASRSDATSF